MPAKKTNSNVKKENVNSNKTKVSKNTNKNDNIIKNAPQKENYVASDNLDIADKDGFKESEVEDDDDDQKENDLDDDIDETEKDGDIELENDNIIDEDHEIDDVINDEVLEDELYDNSPKTKTTKKKKVKIDTEDIDDDLCEYNYDEIYDEKKEEPIVICAENDRITLPKLTKYEKVRLIGARAKQISLGAKVMVKNTKGLNPIDIAKLELELKMIPMKIKRILPNNSVEIWKLSELDQ